VKFEFQNPTHLVFGVGTLSQLDEVVRKHGTKAPVVTGGGSVKRGGAFDRAVASPGTCSPRSEADIVEVLRSAL
jgi:alcohol dehydrogenase